MKKYLFFILLAIIIAIPIIILLFTLTRVQEPTVDNERSIVEEKIAGDSKAKAKEEKVAAPIDNWEERITKKPFGIFITPENSPVSPERFSGYHTGVDFETHDEEDNEEIVVKSVCDGEILQVQEVQGYGGVVIQSCEINNEKVTVLYGHLNIKSEKTVKVGDNVEAGNEISILADENSRLSGFERKHLHIGIHKGEEIIYIGYVDIEDKLENWLNIETLL